MRRLRWFVVIGALLMLASACGDDSGGEAADDDAPDSSNAADDTTDDDATDPADDDADESDQSDESDDDDDAGTTPVENFVTIDGEAYPVTIGTCFASPGVDLEVVASLRGSPDSEAYAYVFADGDALTLSALRVTDAANGLDWSNESGDGATGLTLDAKRISGKAPVTSPDGGTATATFDFVCPG